MLIIIIMIISITVTSSTLPSTVVNTRRAVVASRIPIDPSASIKDVLTRAKSDRSYINEARERALLYMSNIKTIKEAMAVISILNLSGDIKNSINVIDQLYEANIDVDTKVFNNVLNGCAKSNDWRLAIDIIERMSANNIKMDAITFGTAISACKGGQWKLSLKLLNDMDKYGVEADTICYSSVVSCLSKYGRWQESLGLMKRMRARNVDIDLITYNTIIYSCSVQGKTDIIMNLLSTLRNEKFALDAYTYSSAIYAFEVANDCDGALNLLHIMISEKGSKGLSFNPTDAAPFNAAISACLKSNQVDKALVVLQLMRDCAVIPDIRTYTLLVAACAKNGEWLKVIELYKDSAHVTRNELIYGSAIYSCNKLDDGPLAMQILTSMIEQGLPVSTGTFNHVISALGSSAGHLKEAATVLELMKSTGTKRNVATYNLLVSCCRLDGDSESAYNFLTEMENDSNLDLNLPLTYPYSNAITVCLVRKNWVLALKILFDMEEKKITRNVVTMNSVIEALDASGETIRSELVYQSALRSGIYNHWHQTSSNVQHNPNSDLIMDLHTLPLSSARCAVMHVLGEIASSKITLTNSLVIITGRGNKSIHKAGVLKVEILEYLSRLGFSQNILTKKQHLNDGRIEISKSELLRWLDVQNSEDRASKAAGKAHRNLFLQVAFAKDNKVADIKAVCPFSAATQPQSPAQADAEVDPLPTSTSSSNKSGGCPARVTDAQVDPLPTSSSSKSGGCPAHVIIKSS